jgi:hypothetical protein
MRALLVSAVLGGSMMLLGCGSSEKNNVQTREVQAAQPARALRHVVLFKFKDEATPEQIQTVVDAFRALPSKIDVIQDFEWGTNVSPEPHSQGLTHAFLLTFKSEADRDAYLPHPAHKEFGRTVGPVLDKVTVVDYWAAE